MRTEYDFSHAIRGITSTRYKESNNVVVIEPDVFEIFPDSESVNEALRALATVIRHRLGTNIKA